MPNTRPAPDVGLRRRACVNCTKGKSKCLPISEDQCERCSRLGKPCVYQNVLTKRKSPGTSRVRLLEKKLEDLVSLIGHDPQNPALAEILSQMQSSTARISPTLDLADYCRRRQHPQYLANLGTRDVIERGLIDLETVQSFLDEFRRKAVWHFPFVVIPSHIDAASLRHNAPFLFLCILAFMAVKNCALQKRLGEEIQTQIHKRMMLESETSLELLQGLLVYLAWYQYHFHPEKQQIVQLVQLCIAQVHALGLDQNPENSKRMIDLGPPETERCRTTSRSTDELRALLGTYCTASWIATKFGTRCVLPYTKYIQQTHQLLALNKEQPTDELISHLAQMQELCRRICNAFAYDDLSNTEIDGERKRNLTVQAFVQELDHLQDSIPQDTIKITALNLEFTLARTLIHEVALHADFWNSRPARKPLSSTSLDASFTMRYSMIHTLVENCKELLRRVIECPEDEMWHLTFFTYAKVCRVLSCLKNLIYVQTDIPTASADSAGSPMKMETLLGWDAVVARGGHDLQALARQLQLKFGSMARLISKDEDEVDSMTMFSGMIDDMLSIYEEKRRDRDVQSGHRGNTLQGSNTSAISWTVPGSTHDVGFLGHFVDALFN